MESQITIRFFEIQKQIGSDPDLGEIWEEIYAITPASDREVTLTDDYHVRLENLEPSGQTITGELVRCQDTNMPSELTDEERKELEVERLGHSIAFHFDKSKNILAVQYDARIVSPGKVLQYAQNFRAGLEYTMLPLVNEEAWKTFNDNPLRRMKVRISSPKDLALVGPQNAAIEEAFKSMGEAYDAPSITIEISMGQRKGRLSEAVKSIVRRFKVRDGDGSHVEALSVGTFIEDHTETINLLKDIKVDKEKLDLHSRDPDANWKIKRDHIRQVYARLFT